MTGRQLKQIIERSGIRTNAFAEKMGISPQSLNSVFNSSDVKSGTIEKAAEIIDRYRGQSLLLRWTEGCTGYRHFAMRVNQELPDKVTTYWARHSWATIAASLDIPDDVISQALGHSSHNATTSVYIQRDQKKVDIANRRVIDWVLYGRK